MDRTSFRQLGMRDFTADYASNRPPGTSGYPATDAARAAVSPVASY